MRSRFLALALVVVVAAGLATVGRPLLPRWELHVAGVVRGERLDAAPGQNAPNATDPVRAEVRCNGISAQAAPDGSYSLAVPLAARYTCTAASPPTYAPQRVDLPEDDAGSIQINFGGLGDQCAYAPGLPVLSCPPLKLAPGSITGRALAPDGSAAGSGITVKCGLAGAQTALDGLHAVASTTTDASGAFTLASLHPGDYDCLASSAAGGAQAQQTRVTPGQTASIRLSLCVRSCPAVRYHGGPVMHTFTAYLIFWLPKGYSFEPGAGGDDARYQALITQYFRDVDGTPYYGLLTQYFDYQGPVQNTVRLGGVYKDDTTGYQHCPPLGADCHAAAATRSDPLTDDDIAAEVGRALKVNSAWRIGPDAEFFVYTGAGVEECAAAKLTADCTFKDHDHSFCAYHTAAASSLASVPTIYAYVPDPASHQNGCALGSSPNGDVIADSAIDFSAHEQFESVTDPMQLSDQTVAWFDDAQRTTGRNEGEIGDKCVSDFGHPASDGGNITLANGHRYLLQAMWSNSAGGCVFQ